MSLARRFALKVPLAALAGLVGAVALSLPVPPSSARAGEPAAAAAAPARQAALDAAIHRLERHLTALRRSRTELESGRPEPVPADDVARRRADVDQRAVREVSRYESARGKAVAALADAVASKDAAKVGDAQAALEALDAKFVDGMKKLEESLDAPAAGADKGAGPGKGAGPAKAAPNDAEKAKGEASPPPKKAAKPTGKTSMSEGGASDDEAPDDDADDDLAADGAPAR